MAIKDQTRMTELCGCLRSVLLESGWNNDEIEIKLGCDESVLQAESYLEIDAEIGDEVVLGNHTHDVSLTASLHLSAVDRGASSVESYVASLEDLMMGLGYDELNREEDARFYVCQYQCRGRGAMRVEDKSWVVDVKADLIVQF